jgi:nucleotide-binding universal stress UspA family protein
MQHILVCLDFSELSKQVIPFAVTLARGFGARITILHVLEKSDLDSNSPMDCFEWEMQKHEATRYLNAIKSELRNRDILVSVQMIEGQPAEQIHHWINTHDVNLTVLCSHGTNGQTQWPLASTAQKLISGTSSAILLIPAKSLATHTSYDNNSALCFRKLLVPLDGSSWAESALAYAVNIANYQHCEMVLAHVIPESGIMQMEPLNPEGLALAQNITEYNRNVASHYLDKIESRLKSTTKIPVKTSLINNHGVADELINIVDAQAIDLVIMSAHGSSNHQGQYCGKTALDFLEHCHVPVMLLRGNISQKKAVDNLDYSLLESTSRLPLQAAL